tara:strand:+ start:1069 stop:2034 length:966 start_codon:yes stop_codon:yes gene_type:complete
MKTEFLTSPEEKRYVLFPIRYPKIWNAQKKQQACFWQAEELDLSKDKEDWLKLNDNEKHFIKNVLAFFAGSDGIVLENLLQNFTKDVTIMEAQVFYTFQAMMENIHAETYSLLIDTYIKDEQEKHKLFNAIDTIPSVAKKAEWAKKWINSDSSFAIRLIAFAAVEGIFFSGSFCSIFWLKRRGLMPGLTFSNELISRDEGMHTDFAVLLYSMIQNKPEYSTIKQMIVEAVEIEKEFIIDSIPCNLIGMNQKLMSQYIEFVADRLVQQLGYEPIYQTKNPFDFMELMSLNGKTNFFERRVSDYSLVQKQDEEEDEFALDADF